jgi:putative hydrolase of the HAD superfamily
MIDTIFFDNWNTLVQAPSLMHKGSGVKMFYDLITVEGISCSFKEFSSLYSRITKAQMVEADKDDYREPNYEDLIYQAINGLSVTENMSRVLAKKVWQSYLDEWPRETIFYPDTPRLLKDLKGRYRLGVISNFMESSRCRRVFKNLGYYTFFDALIVSAEVGHRKPSKKIFEQALDLIGSLPETSLMVGDTLEADIIGAKNMGLKAVLVDPNYSETDLHPHADALIKNIGNLRKILNTL